MSLVFY